MLTVDRDTFLATGNPRISIYDMTENEAITLWIILVQANRPDLKRLTKDLHEALFE